MKYKSYERPTRGERHNHRLYRIRRHVVTMIGDGIVRGGNENFTLFEAKSCDDWRIRTILPQRVATAHRRRIHEVVRWRRGLDCPLQRARAPRIGSRDKAPLSAP